MSAHINAVGEFQSDKYPTCPAGKVPLSTKDPTAQDLLWEYAQRRREVDSEFADDLEVALRSKGYVPKSWVCGTCHATDDRGDICPDCANRMYPSGERDARIATLESALAAARDNLTVAVEALETICADGCDVKGHDPDCRAADVADEALAKLRAAKEGR